MTGTWCPKDGAVKSHPGPCPHLREQKKPAPVESPSEGHRSNRIPAPKSQMSATAEGPAGKAQVQFPGVCWAWGLWLQGVRKTPASKNQPKLGVSGCQVALLDTRTLGGSL